MEKFKITNEIKRELVREIKRSFKEFGYSDVVIIYNTSNNTFCITDSEDATKLENKRPQKYLIYKKLDLIKDDYTLVELEKMIFN